MQVSPLRCAPVEMTELSGTLGGVGRVVDGVECFYAAEADGGVGGVLAYVRDVAPAAVALGGGGAFGLQAWYGVGVVVGDLDNIDLGYVEEFGKRRRVSSEEVLFCFADVLGDGCLERFADHLFGAEGFEFGEDIGAKGEEGGPVS